MNITAEEISKHLLKMGNKKDAKFLQGFFKTGPGQYGEGDIFLGIRVPALRKLAKEYQKLSPEKYCRYSNLPITKSDCSRSSFL